MNCLLTVGLHHQSAWFFDDTLLLIYKILASGCVKGDLSI